MNILFIFMDGVGLGVDDPAVNPLVRARLPNLDEIMGGKKLIADRYQQPSSSGSEIINTSQATLIAVDACLGIDGAPQSASGQASLLTGNNVSAILGSHSGPKPNPQIMEILKDGTLFSHLNQEKRKVTLINAYPPRYFKSIESGHRLPGVIALSAIYAGLQLRTKDDLERGEAISVDFTAQGWRDQLGLTETPRLDLIQAGERLRNLSDGYELAFFEYWLSDVVGHHQDMQGACDLLEIFDAVLGSLVDEWNDDGLILITSDHGNIEDLSTRHHTRNEVPLMLIGSQPNRDEFIQNLEQARGSEEKFSLTHITPAILTQDGISK